MPWSGASSALTSCPLVSFVVKPLSQRRTPSYTNQDVFPRSAAASNRHFKRGIRGPVRLRSLNLHVSPSLQPVISLFRRIISLLCGKYLPVTDLFRVHANFCPTYCY